MQIELCRYRSPLGELKLTFENAELSALEYAAADQLSGLPALAKGSTRDWLDHYFSATSKHNAEAGGHPPLKICGTPFQRKVWQALLQIPYGSTCTYGELAKSIGSAARAVGQACKRNHLPIIIPCHRVVARNSVGGYEGATSGQRLDRKTWLLQHEKNLTNIA